MYRYHPQTIRLAELVREGAIGELRLMSAAFTWPCDAPGDVRLSVELGGGSLLDVGCYCVSAARLLAGEPSEVTAQQHSATDRTRASCPRCRRPRGRCGRERECLEPALTLTPRAGELCEIPTAAVNSHRLELEQMAAAVDGGHSQLLGGEDALGQARTIEALSCGREKTAVAL